MIAASWPAFFFFLAGFGAAWLLCRHHGYEQGFSHGERYGRTCGYRQAWLRQSRFRRVGLLHSLDSDRYES
jgi:hypothetical protein